MIWDHLGVPVGGAKSPPTPPGGRACWSLPRFAKPMLELPPYPPSTCSELCRNTRLGPAKTRVGPVGSGKNPGVSTNRSLGALGRPKARPRATSKIHAFSTPPKNHKKHDKYIPGSKNRRFPLIFDDIWEAVWHRFSNFF